MTASLQTPQEQPAEPLPLSGVSNWLEEHSGIVLFCVGVMLAAQITPWFELNRDGINYMSIARNLVLHHRLERLGMPHIHYAPGYAFLISPAFFFGDRPFIAIQIIHLLFESLLAIGLYAWAARCVGRGAIFVMLAVMVNAGFLDLYRQASAENAFIPALIGASVLLSISTSAPSRAKAYRFAIGGAVLLMCACLIRQMGVFLSVGYAIALVARAIRREMPWVRAIFMAAIVGVSAMAITSGLVLFDQASARRAGPHAVPYTQLLKPANQSAGAEFAEGIRRQTAEIGRLLIPGMWKTYASPGEWLNVNTIIFLLASVAIAIGWWKLVRSSLDPLALSFPIYFLFCVLYPLDSGTRFTVPMLGVVMAAMWFLLQPVMRERTAIMIVFIAIHLIVSIGFWIKTASMVRKGYSQWPVMEHVAAIVPRQANNIALRGVSYDRELFFMYLTDRQVAPEKLNEPVDPTLDWILTGRESAEIAGFKTIGTAEDLKLEERITAEAK